MCARSGERIAVQCRAPCRHDHASHYEFDGKDRYKVCFDPSGKGRPTAFATGTGGCHVLHVWKRVKKA